jgi:molybdopterin converting factor small subunit
MRVSINLLCADMDVPRGSRGIDVADGATVGQAIDAYLARYPGEDPEGKLPTAMFLVGRKPAQLDTVLRDNDALLVIRILHGG